MQVHMWQLRLLRKVCMMKGVCRCNHWTIDTVTMHYGEEQFRTFLSCLHFATIIKLSNLNSIDRLQNAWSWWPSFRLSSFMAIFRCAKLWRGIFYLGPAWCLLDCIRGFKIVFNLFHHQRNEMFLCKFGIRYFWDF